MNSTNNQPRAVLWDLDGTLIDSMPYHWQAWQDVLEPLGYHFTPEQFAPSIGLRNDEIVRDVLKLDRPRPEIEHIVESKEIRYRAIVRERGLIMLPGVQHWLTQLKAGGWRQAIVTSAPRLNVKAILAVIDLDQIIDTIICAEDVMRGKPDPQPFELAAARLSVPPDRCIVIEDAPAGLEGARRASMKSIGVLTTHSSLQADCVVKSLADLPSGAFDALLHAREQPDRD
jgi:HAD superfamily hydrolase (TIGR01509 family)